jgi:hypothetical protein
MMTLSKPYRGMGILPIRSNPKRNGQDAHATCRFRTLGSMFSAEMSFVQSGLCRTFAWLAVSLSITLLPCMAEDAAPLYKVGVLYGSDEAVVARWKSAAEWNATKPSPEGTASPKAILAPFERGSGKSPVDVTGISYADVIAEPDKLLAFDCLVLADSPGVPADLQPELAKFARGGGDLIFAGGLAFSRLPANQKPFTDLAFDPQSRFRFQGEFSVRPWNQANASLPAGALSPDKITLAGSSALGFAFPGQSEFHPLLEVVDSEGRRVAWAVGLLQHTGDEFNGSNWLMAGIEGKEFYQSPGLLAWMLDTVRSYSAPRSPDAAPAATASSAGKITIGNDGGLVRPDGSPFFIVGTNYCGPFDAKLEEFFGKNVFSPEVLDAEFAKFQAVGINVLRSFSFGRMGTLEAPGERVQAIRDSARRHGIYLMPEIGLKALLAGPLDIADNAKHAAAVARAYRGDPMVLGYDMANEPYLTEVGSMTFHGEPSPLVKLRPYETMTELMNKNMNKDWIDRQMQTTDGWLNLPHWLSPDTKRELLASVSIWIAYLKEQGGSDSTFPGLNGKIDIQNSGKYAPFLTVLNETFTQWIDVMIQAIRSEDPDALITIGYNTALVALPVNEKLDFLNSHIYQRPYNFKDTEISLGTFDRLHAMYPNKPVTMGEFGLSNGLVLNGASANYQTQALWEILHWLYPYAHGFGGVMKWMDNDWTTPYIHRYAKWWTDPKTLAYEEQFGLFRFDGTPSGTPKPIAWCTKFFADYLQSNPKPGKLSVFETKNQVRAGFEYLADTAWFYGGEAFANRAIRWENPETKVVMVRWDAKTITLMSTVDLELEIDPAAMVNPPALDPSPENWRKIKLFGGTPLTISR